MSLQVWLPLNGDLHNQGLSNVIATNNGATIDNSGKIGKCYSFDGIDDYFTLTNINCNAWAQCTIAFWCYPTNNFNYIFLIRGGGAHRFRISGDGLVFRDTNHSNQANVPFNATININTWNHIVCAYNRGEVFIYINGVLTNHSTTYYNSASVLLSDLNEYRIARQQSTSADNYYTGKINDFRIYDHCLSPKEVEEISKGLILHYKLDNNGMGNPNLLKGNYHVTTTSTSNNPIGSLSLDTSLISLNDLIGKTLYFSYDYSVEGNRANNTGDYTKDRYGIHGTLSYITSSGTTSNNYPFAGFLEARGTGRAIQSFTIPADAQSISTFSFAIQAYNKPADVGITWYIRNCKLEIENATPYTPNSSDLNLDTSIIYDSSGYNNNAISNGNIALKYSTDTPRYNVSTEFASGARIATPVSASAFMPTDAITVNIWFKSLNAANRFISCTEGGGFNFESNSGNIRFVSYVAGQGYAYANSTTSWSSVSDNKWHMLTGINDKSTIKIYLDGQLIQETTSQYPNSILGYAGSTPFTLGAEAQTIASPIAGTYVGNLSDIRIYATAITIAQIKELYNTSASIDSFGNIYSREVMEI